MLVNVFGRLEVDLALLSVEIGDFLLDLSVDKANFVKDLTARSLDGGLLLLKSLKLFSEGILFRVFRGLSTANSIDSLSSFGLKVKKNGVKI